MGQLSYTRFLGVVIAVCCINYCAGLFCNVAEVTDKMCKVGFNYTVCDEDVLDTLYDDDQLKTCINQTLFEPDGTPKERSRETMKCRAKCRQEALGFFNKDGTFNLENIANRVKAAYKTYSNATTAYAEKIAKLATDCVERAQKKLQQFKESEKKPQVSSCAINGIFAKCYNFADFSLKGNWSALNEICAAQGTTWNFRGNGTYRYWNMSTTQRPTSPRY